MSDNQVNNLLGVTMDKIKQMVDVNTRHRRPGDHPGRHHGDSRLPGELRLCLGRLGPAL